MKTIVGSWLVAALALLHSDFAAAQRQLPPMKIEQLTKSVYRYGGLTNGAFVVGKDAIAVVDGQICGSNGTQWLKDELKKRFPGIPVKYTILSHDHEMHICGLEVFSDTAIAISHVNAKSHIIREHRRTVIPTVTFDTNMEIDVGGVAIDLIYLGPTHGDNLIQVHIPSEKVLIAVDFVRTGKSLAMPELRDLEYRQLDPRARHPRPNGERRHRRAGSRRRDESASVHLRPRLSRGTQGARARADGRGEGRSRRSSRPSRWTTSATTVGSSSGGARM